MDVSHLSEGATSLGEKKIFKICTTDDLMVDHKVISGGLDRRLTLFFSLSPPTCGIFVPEDGNGDCYVSHDYSTATQAGVSR